MSGERIGRRAAACLAGSAFALAALAGCAQAPVPDQALRRRFSFVDMPADAAVLASWLEEHPPAEPGDETFGPRVVRLFEELNRRLARDLGPERQVGHSFFMVHLLDPQLSAGSGPRAVQFVAFQ